MGAQENIAERNINVMHGYIRRINIRVSASGCKIMISLGSVTWPSTYRCSGEGSESFCYIQKQNSVLF